MRKPRRLHARGTASRRKHAWWGSVVLVLAGVFMWYCFVRPTDTGVVGGAVNGILRSGVGVARFLIPPLTWYLLWNLVLPFRRRTAVEILSVLTLFALICGLLVVAASILRLDPGLGGAVGAAVHDIFQRVLGEPFGSVAMLLTTLYMVSLMADVSVPELAVRWWVVFVEDIRAWSKAARSGQSDIQPERVRRNPRAARTVQPAENPVEPPPPPPRTITVDVPERPAPDTAGSRQPRAERLNPAPAPRPAAPDAPDSASAAPPPPYIPPSPELLQLPDKSIPMDQDGLNRQAEQLEGVLRQFDITARVVNISSGPVLTMYEMELEPGVKVQSVLGLKDNIALGMKAVGVRIVAPLAGRGTIGVEIPNPKTRIVRLREIIESPEYQTARSTARLPIALGKTVDGKPVIADIAPMPHMLVAGSTGSGKSVCVHSIMTSLLFHCSPSDLKFLLIDPKRLELTGYDGIPHIYDPNRDPAQAHVITTPRDAARALTGLVRVMELRYEKFAHAGVRNIDGYNAAMAAKGGPREYYIVVVIDEFADLMLTVGKEIEDAIQRLAQMARAVGIHLVLATQRPSVDVITGVIKANFPCRVAFQVLSKTDSRVILDAIGAEDLLGRGDMLFLPTGAPKPVRLQCAFVSEQEVQAVIGAITAQNIPPAYESLAQSGVSPDVPREKELKQQEDLLRALKYVRERRRVSQDLLKSLFGGSARASDMLSQLEIKGFIYKPEGTNRWSINFDRIDEALAAAGAAPAPADDELSP